MVIHSQKVTSWNASFSRDFVSARVLLKRVIGAAKRLSGSFLFLFLRTTLLWKSRNT